MLQLPDDDHALLGSFDALREQLAFASSDPVIARAVCALRRDVEARLGQLRTEARALADANARGAEIYAEIETIAKEARAQNEALREHNSRLEAAQTEAAKLVEALADANVRAALEMDGLEAERETASSARAAIVAERERIAHELGELRKQSTALADANVEMLMVAEARAEQVDELKTRLEREHEKTQTFREQALLDGLTGLYSRRYYDEQVRLEFSRARRYGRELSVAFIDVDHFKKYNDGNGHHAGDELLAQLSRLVRSTVRVADLMVRTDGEPFAARYGGEELILLLPETPLTGAYTVAERLRRIIADTDFAGGEKQPLGKVTVSIGVAALAACDASGVELVQRADAALYRAKTAGRNRVEIGQ
jgi:diguanylate cyclase (GGDEF)-like protein